MVAAGCTKMLDDYNDELRIIGDNMKKILLGLTLFVAASLVFTLGASAQSQSPDHVTTIENYYKVIPGHQQEFLQLFMKNHYPLLEKELATGRLIFVKFETPSTYMPEDVRWDYRITIQTKGSAASNTDYETALKLQMWRDQESFKREEKQRFDAVLAHWDITVTDITPEKK